MFLKKQDLARVQIPASSMSAFTQLIDRKGTRNSRPRWAFALALAAVAFFAFSSPKANAQANQNNFNGGTTGAGSCVATVSTLSSACGTKKGTLATVTDGSSTSDCTVGSGSNTVTCIYTGSAWAYAGSSSALSGQVKGQNTVGLTSTTAGASNEVYKVSTFCGTTAAASYNTCPSVTDESVAIVAAYTACKSGGTAASSCHIVDDMCGTQTISVNPWSIAGHFDMLSNCSSANPHVWSLDGIGTLTAPSSGLTVTGMGGNGFLQQPTNVFVQACNTNIDNCVNGGYQVPNASIASFTVSGAVATVVLGGGGIPATGNGPGVMAPGRLLYVGPDSPTANNRGAWVIQTVTDATHLTVGVVSGTTSTCSSTCGTGYLDTPIASIGASTGSGAFDVVFDQMLFDCHFVIGCGGFVNGVGQENSRFLMTHVANADVYYGRLDQSAAYNGSGTSGATNSGPYGPWSGNINPELCAKTGGCACKVGTANGMCPSSPVAVGTPMTCGSGTTGTAAIISPDPCDNPNFMGFAFTGVGGAQGFRQVLGITASIQDKTQTGGTTGVPGLLGGTGGETGSSAATTSAPLLVCGARATVGDTHTEFFMLAAEIGCDPAVSATWADYYSGILTSSVAFTGGLWAFGTGGIGLDLGSSGGGAFLQDVALNQVSIGNGSGNLITDNVTGNSVTGSASEQSQTYFHGHGTQPVVWGSSPTIGFQSQLFKVLGSSSGSCSITAGTTGSPLNLCGNATITSAGALTVTSCTGCGSSGAWSSISNGSGNLAITPGGTSIFSTTTAAAQFFAFKNTTAAIVSLSQGSPFLGLCGRAWHGSADVEDCLTLSELPGNGNDAAIAFNFGHTGGSTGVVTTNFPGPISSSSDGVHAAYVAFGGNTANYSVTSNTAGFMGPASASFTAYALQLPSTGPTAGQGLAFKAAASSVNVGVAIPQDLPCADTSASATTFTCSTGLSLASYANGQCFTFYAVNQNNSGASTLNVDGIAAKSLVKWQGTALAASDLKAASSQKVCYDGTNLEVSTIGNAPSGGGGSYSLMGNNSVSYAVSPEYVNFPGNVAGATTSPATAASIISTAQTIDTLYVHLNVAVAAAASVTYTLTYGATVGAMADTTLTCTVAATTTDCSDLTHSFTTAAGGFIALKITYTGTPGSTAGNTLSVKAH